MSDVLVAGGGPVGLAAAIGARRAGFGVTVLEPRRGVLDKACGEGLFPGALGELAALGAAPAPAHPLSGIRYVDGARQAEADLRTPGAGVRRLALHEALLERARGLGVRWLHRSAGPIRQDADGVDAGGLRGRWLLAADGLHSPLRRQLGLLGPPRRPPRLGVRRHFAAAPWTDRVEVHLGPGAEAYVTPVSPECVGVALLYGGPARRCFEALLPRFPALRARLGPPCSRERGAGPFEQRVRRRVAGRVLLVGDAAGYLDPLTGEGIQLGLVSARLAVEAIREGDPEGYERAWRRSARAPWWLTELLLRVRRSSRVSARMVPVLQAAPWLFRAGLRALAGEERPGV